MKYLIFHTAADDSYMNTVENFRGADAGAEFVDMYFASATVGAGSLSGYDKVRLTVTATYEESALEGVGAALAGVKNPVMVIADDVNSKYIHDRITAVASITLGSRVQTRIVENIAAAKNIEASDSGKFFTIDQDAAFAITLPTVAQAGAGWFATFMINDIGTNAVTIIPDSTEDTLSGFVMSGDGGTGGSAVGVDTLTFINGAETGDKVDIFCDGTIFYCYMAAHDAAHITLA